MKRDHEQPVFFVFCIDIDGYSRSKEVIFDAFDQSAGVDNGELSDDSSGPVSSDSRKRSRLVASIMTRDQYLSEEAHVCRIPGGKEKK